MLHITFWLFADLMVWVTVPLIVGLGFWEHHLTLTDIDHKLVQMVLVVIGVGWAYLWNSMGERDRLAHYKSQVASRSKICHIEPGITKQGKSILVSANDSRHLLTKKEVSIEIVKRYHVSNN